LYRDDSYNSKCAACGNKVNLGMSFADAHKDVQYDRYHNRMVYNDARAIAIEIWRLRSLGLDAYDYFQSEQRKYRNFFQNCPLCEIFAHNCLALNDISCPLKWEEPRPEYRSSYCKYNRPCSRNYWHWLYWAEKPETNLSKRQCRYWAGKLHQELLETPEE